MSKHKIHNPRKFAFGTLEDIRKFVEATADLPGDTLFHSPETTTMEVTEYRTHSAMRLAESKACRPSNGW